MHVVAFVAPKLGNKATPKSELRWINQTNLTNVVDSYSTGIEK